MVVFSIQGEWVNTSAPGRQKSSSSCENYPCAQAKNFARDLNNIGGTLSPKQIILHIEAIISKQSYRPRPCLLSSVSCPKQLILHTGPINHARHLKRLEIRSSQHHCQHRLQTLSPRSSGLIARARFPEPPTPSPPTPSPDCRPSSVNGWGYGTLRLSSPAYKAHSSGDSEGEFASLWYAKYSL